MKTILLCRKVKRYRRNNERIYIIKFAPHFTLKKNGIIFL